MAGREAPWLGLGPADCASLAGVSYAEWEPPAPGPELNSDPVVVALCVDNLFNFFESVSVFTEEA